MRGVRFLAVAAFAAAVLFSGQAEAADSIGWGEAAEEVGLAGVALALGILLLAIVVTGILFMINPGAAIALAAAVVLGGVWASRAETVRDIISGTAGGGASIAGYIDPGRT